MRRAKPKGSWSADSCIHADKESDLQNDRNLDIMGLTQKNGQTGAPQGL